MKLVEQLAEYYRLSRHAEVQNCLSRWWLLQGEARIAYLKELLEPIAENYQDGQFGTGNKETCSTKGDSSPT
ncbi:hypothetical protein Z042_23880 [Chania multitudinisentens RB-25]|uniref:Uncharacterized protein n=1 Tax=Chania multitudinisentens RB-25 TaxID=1441930 RepID=W0LJY7_9GAMM|nr:hypothetical protein [Chania multitudinisentens]AHG22300.1 hypothetical protein Z042_23880 [Chania multitudinisentens RB-25]